MNDEPRSPERGAEVLSTLPRSRPHRRSSKRPAPGASAVVDPPAPAGPPAPERPAPAAAPPAPAASSAPAAAGGPAAPGARKPAPAAHRRRAGGTERPERLRQPPQPRGLPPKPDRAPGAQPELTDAGRPALVATAVQAAAELAEIGLTLSARALRRAVSRLPRP